MNLILSKLKLFDHEPTLEEIRSKLQELLEDFKNDNIPLINLKNLLNDFTVMMDVCNSCGILFDCSCHCMRFDD